MRDKSKQHAIRRARLKFIKIAMIQNKVLAIKRSEMRDKWLASKVKLKGGSNAESSVGKYDLRYSKQC
jgi:hypothetical protein